jgi:hypothetical protein
MISSISGVGDHDRVVLIILRSTSENELLELGRIGLIVRIRVADLDSEAGNRSSD